MSTNDVSMLFVQNPYQNTGQAVLEGPFSNLRCGDLLRPVTVAEFNANIGSSLDMAERMSPTPVQSMDENDEPLFGVHLREAAATLRKVFSR